MSQYYVNRNAQTNGDHEVHTTGCPHLPAAQNRAPLGDFPHCSPAVIAAKVRYPQSDGCYYCCSDCHKS